MVKFHLPVKFFKQRNIFIGSVPGGFFSGFCFKQQGRKNSLWIIHGI
jgi:hypothetical protein